MGCVGDFVISKLVYIYNSNNYGLWYANNSSLMGLLIYFKLGGTSLRDRGEGLDGLNMKTGSLEE